jgi:hypothetical protein
MGSVLGGCLVSGTGRDDRRRQLTGVGIGIAAEALHAVDEV